MDNPAMTWEEAVLWLRAQPDRADLVRDCFYDDPLNEAAERYYRSSEWVAVRELLKGCSGKALDIGAGRGISSYALARDGWDVTSLEPDRSIIVGAGAIRSLAEKTSLEINVVEEWGETLPFIGGSFDLVYARQALHHARDLGMLCKEIGRVLKPGGLLLATREHVISKREDLPAFLANHPLHALYGGENAYLLSEYTAAIRNGGIKLLLTLNPLQSEINLFPDTFADCKKKFAARLRMPWPGLIPEVLLRCAGYLDTMPGRLYSFLGRKSA